MGRANRSLVALAVATWALATVSGCGGSSGSAPGSTETERQGPGAKELLDAAFNHPIPDSLTRANLAVDLRGNALLSRGRVSVSGPYLSGKGKRIPSVDWRVRASTGVFGVDARVISTGDDVFVDLGGSTYEVGRQLVAAQNRSVRAATRAAGGTPKPLANLGLHPRRWFRGGRVVGDERVDGVDCAHVTAALDAPAIIEDGHAVANRVGLTGAHPAPTHFTPAQAASVGEDVRSGRIDAWIGRSDEIVRRFRVIAAFRVPAGQRAGLAGTRGGTVRLDILQLRVGKGQEVRGPRPGSGIPIAKLLGRLGGIPGI